MDRRDVGSWITGDTAATEDQASGPAYRGERLGLPESGPGSMASTGLRVLALVIDWFACMVIARVLFGAPDSALGSFGTLFVFFIEVALLTWLTGASFGQRIVGIRVVGRSRRVGFTAAAIRTLLICLAVPPLIWDADGRGLHDRAVDSVVVRA
jgi:uncharacterized RDD family membrane protein YckC